MTGDSAEPVLASHAMSRSPETMTITWLEACTGCPQDKDDLWLELHRAHPGATNLHVQHRSRALWLLLSLEPWNNRLRCRNNCDRRRPAAKPRQFSPRLTTITQDRKICLLYESNRNCELVGKGSRLRLLFLVVSETALNNVDWVHRAKEAS
jgi:hypothetical protein